MEELSRDKADYELLERLTFSVIATGEISGFGLYSKGVVYEAASIFSQLKGYYYMGMTPEEFIERPIRSQRQPEQ